MFRIIIKAFFLFVISSVAYAIEVGNDIELLQIMNARRSADFTRFAKNIKGQLSAGTKAKVLEVKKFRTGNSGFLLEVKDGNLRNQKVWVHYNPQKPSLKLYNSRQQVVTDQSSATDAVTREETPALLDPSVPPVLQDYSTSTNGSTQPDSTREIPTLIDAANAAVRSGGTPEEPCRNCSDQAQAGAPSGPPQVPSPVGAAVHTNRGVALDVDANGFVKHAEIDCEHAGEYKSFAGRFRLKIENNRVLHFESSVDNGRCIVSSRTFTQVQMGNNNIVLRNPAGCAVTITPNGESVERGGALYSQRVTPQNAELHLGVILLENGPCDSICSKAREGRLFWQVKANPRTQRCN